MMKSRSDKEMLNIKAAVILVISFSVGVASCLILTDGTLSLSLHKNRTFLF